MTEQAPEPVDPAEVLATLAAYWADPVPSRHSSGIPGRLAGSPRDQIVPEGTANPYWEIIRQMPLDTIGSPFRSRPEPDPYFFDPRNPAQLLTDRFRLCATFAWSIPSPGDIAWITERLSGRGLVEPGAGGGYWAWLLTQAGADIVAYDPAEAGGGENKHASREWHPVLRAGHDAVRAHPDRSMLLCWPTYSQPWAAWSLATYKGDQLFYAGEGEGGCCADDEFFALLAAEWDEVADCPHHVTYSGIHCYLTEYARKASR